MKTLIRLLLLLGLTVSAHAELTIEITQTADNAAKVAVVPFSGTNLNDNIGDIVNADLVRSGRFRALAPTQQPARPDNSGAVLFNEWRPTGVDYVVVGKQQQLPDGRITITYELVSVTKGSRLVGESLTVPPSQWRDAAHFIADRVFELVTGTRGAFSTRMLYVNRYKQGGKARYRLEMADADGFRPVNVLDSPEPILSPTWSPDGRRIAYVSFESGRPAIFIQETTTAKREKLTSFVGLNSAPAWSPDGRKLALTLSRDGNPEIYVMDLASKELTRLTNHYAIDTEPRWHPDGKRIVFTSDRGGNPQIYQLDVQSQAVKRLTFEGSYNARADVSADGRYLALVHRERGQQFQIAVLDLQTQILNVLTETPLDESPSFAPNGAMVAYATRQGSQGVLGIASLDGKFKARLPSSRGEVREPSWSPFLR